MPNQKRTCLIGDPLEMSPIRHVGLIDLIMKNVDLKVKLEPHKKSALNIEVLVDFGRFIPSQNIFACGNLVDFGRFIPSQNIIACGNWYRSPPLLKLLITITICPPW